MDPLNEDCCICYERNLRKVLKNGTYNCVRLTCCGNCYCTICNNKMWRQAEVSGIKWTCPMCRALATKSRKERFYRVMVKAEAGKSWAMEILGQYYYEGYGVSQSFTKAFEFYSRAADLGEAISQQRVGYMYKNGEGVDQSYEQVFKYYSLAAEKGLPNAQNSVGCCYEHGWGVKKSMEKAFEWYTLAAENGFPTAQFNLANCYFDAKGINQSNKDGMQLLTLSAEQGWKDAQFQLASIYQRGEIVSKSYPLAIYWFKQCLKDDNKDEKQCAEAKEHIKSLLLRVLEVCASCNKKKKEEEKFVACAKCLSACYCNQKCQINHWGANGGHKRECRAP